VADGRAVVKILSEWRLAERMVADMPDSPARRAIETRIAQLREEHRLAMADREGEMTELRDPYRP
jgi:hypothetical protein